MGIKKKRGCPRKNPVLEQPTESLSEAPAIGDTVAGENSQIQSETTGTANMIGPPQSGPIKTINPQPAETEPKHSVHCIYHHDLDGCAAAAIVRMRLPWAKLYPIDYNYQVLPETEENAELIFVDFTPRLTDLTDLVRQGSRHIVWIDHHRTAIEEAGPEGFGRLPGLRDIDHSGAYLAWQFFYPQLPIPKVIELVDRWDTWTHENADEVLNFKAGIDIYENASPDSDIWSALLVSDNPELALETISAAGKAIMQSKRNYWKKCCEMYGFDCRFRHLRYGKLKLYALFLPDCSSLAFESKPGYDAYLAIVYNGLQYRVTMYGASPAAHVDEIATHFGGGGHPDAVGFWCDELPLTTDEAFDGRGSPAATLMIPAAIKG